MPNSAIEELLPVSKRRMRLRRHNTEAAGSPYDGVNWVKFDAKITSGTGDVLFEQKGVEFPDYFSQTAVNIATQHYLKGRMGTPERETSFRQVINRVAFTLATWGEKQGYFQDHEEMSIFQDELSYALVHQMFSFNSPVYYNVGVQQECQGFCHDLETGETRPIRKGEQRPQGSACFILHVEDTIHSILNWYGEEGMVFKYGSGAGLNISSIRSKKEYLTGGGVPSGPLSFAKAADISAGTLKSGGKNRRAAKMLILNAEHPDIEDFIVCKVKEEKKAKALIAAGYSAEFNVEDGAYDSIFYQNANNSVRATDEFMQAVVAKRPYWTKRIMNGEPFEEKDANDVMTRIAQATWECGDPGMQFDTTINKWNTCLDTEPIRASNPCSEYMFLDNTACNLLSHNLIKYHSMDADNKPTFDVEGFKRSIEIATIAQELLVGNAGYPTEAISRRSFEYRTLGQGYANLGSLIMHWGFPYDSEEARSLAASVTSFMSAYAYRVSAELAERVGPFPEFEKNKRSMVKVLRQHMAASHSIEDHFGSADIWKEAFDKATAVGVRNAQISVLAPTGTIGFLMDVDTTGVEPDLALVKNKKMVGGGYLKIVNRGVHAALLNLGYSEKAAAEIEAYVFEKGTVEGCPALDTRHLEIFDCSFPAPGFKRTIAWEGHLKMMAAVQPFISGAISKTVNMPETATVEDIKQAFVMAWRMGLKAVAIYRDNCKMSQPMSTKEEQKKGEVVARQRKMPPTRKAVTHEFRVGEHKAYLTVGLYEDGSPGEMFIDISKEGSTVSGLLGCFAIAVSFALQHGVPLEKFVSKFSHMKFEPAGYTGTDLGYASSIPDYIFRWMSRTFTPGESACATITAAIKGSQQDAPLCSKCGNLMTRNGSCHKCDNCGGTSGCS